MSVSRRGHVAGEFRQMEFETLKVRKEGPVLFAEIAAPPIFWDQNWFAIWCPLFNEPKPMPLSTSWCS